MNSLSYEDQTSGSVKHQIRWPEFLWFLILFFGISFVLMFVMVIGLTFYKEMTGRDLLSIILEGYIWLIIDGVIFFSLFFSFKRIRQFTIKALDFSVMLVPRTYALMLLSMICFMIIQYLLIGVWGIDDSSQQPNDLGFESSDSSPHWSKFLLLYISIALLTPIKEELLFRGIIHRFFEYRYNFWIGFIVSSVIFGLMHTGFPISAISMGMILVLLYRLTNSLIPPIVLHIFWNSLVSLLLINS